MFWHKAFNPNARSYQEFQLISVYRRQERDKQRVYEQRVRKVELGSFTPLVFSTSAGTARAATVAYKQLASLLATKVGPTIVMAWLQCHLAFSLLRSAITCLRGERSSKGRTRQLEESDLAVSETTYIYLPLINFFYSTNPFCLLIHLFIARDSVLIKCSPPDFVRFQIVSQC